MRITEALDRIATQACDEVEHHVPGHNTAAVKLRLRRLIAEAFNLGEANVIEQIGAEAEQMLKELDDDD